MKRKRPDFIGIEEITLALAQSAICNAMSGACLSQSGMARELGITPPSITGLLSGNDIGIRRLARSLAACGKEVRFQLVPLGSPLP